MVTRQVLALKTLGSSPSPVATKSGYATSWRASLSEPGDECEAFILRGRIKMLTVYVLENKNDKFWYIGQTDNLKRRIQEHNSKQGGRTTKIKSGKWKLIYAEAYIDKRDAIGREKFLKGGSGRRYLNKQLAHYLVAS